MRTTRTRRFLLALGLTLAAWPPLPAQAPFLRGDANDDGRVSISDAHAIALWIAGLLPPPPCLDAADANDDGQVTVGFGSRCDAPMRISDAYSVFRDPTNDDPCGEDPCDCIDLVAEPRGAPGQDPTPDDLTCGSWTGAAGTVADPVAKLEVLDARCPGGLDSLAVLKVRISHSRPIGGYAGAIEAFGRIGSWLPDADRTPAADRFDASGADAARAAVRGGRVLFWYLNDDEVDPLRPGGGIMPPAENRVILDIYVRVSPGTPAGDHPLVLLDGELADTTTGRAIVPARVDGVLTVAEDVELDAGVRDVPFIRGDANDDGRVSISDIHYLDLYRAGRVPPPPCLDAADANDDGFIREAMESRCGNLEWIGDALSIWYDSFTDRPCGGEVQCNCIAPVAEPRGQPGEDPTPDDLPCREYTGARGSMSDPAARLEILDAACPGGRDSLAVLKVRISSSRPTGGCSGIIEAFGLFDEWTVTDALELPGSYVSDQSRCVVRGGQVRFDYSSGDPDFDGRPGGGILPPLDDRVLLKLYLRVAQGTPAGEYPLVLLEGEFADSTTGAAILPRLEDAIFTVLEDVALDAEADDGSGPYWECGAREARPPEGPEDVQAALHVGMLPAAQGSTISLPVWIEANVPVEGFRFVIDYGNRAFYDTVRLERVVPVEPEGQPWGAFEFHHDPDHHGVWGEAVFSRTDPAVALEAGRLHHILSLEFQIDAQAADGLLRVNCSESGWPDQQNAVLAYGRFLSKYDVTCLELARKYDTGVLVGGGAGASFVRGDASADGAISIADAVRILWASASGSDLVKLPCQDAGDLNDDGGSNLTDALLLAEHLFDAPREETGIPPPFPGRGPDPTLDPLPCEGYPVVAARATDDVIRVGPLDVVPLEPVEVPILVSVAEPLEALQLVLRYDPATFQPLVNRLRLEGGALPDVDPHGHNVVASNLIPGHIAVGLIRNLWGRGTGPRGRDLLVGTLPGFVGDGLAPGTEILLEPVAVPTGAPAAIDRLRTELVVRRDGKPVPVLPRLEAGVLRVVDGSEAQFIRSDANFDLEVNISDPIFVLGYLFLGGDEPTCHDAADADDSGAVEITDAILTLEHLFGTGPGAPAQPYPERGRDRWPDDLPPCEEPFR